MIDYDMDEAGPAPQGGKVATASRIVYWQGGWPGGYEAFEFDLFAHTFNCEIVTMDGVPDGEHVAERPLPYRFTDGEWAKVSELLGLTAIDGWEKDYNNNECCDGTSWSLSLFEGKTETRRIEGYNDWPQMGWVTIDELLEFACGLAGLPPDTHTLFGNSGEEEGEDDESPEALEQ